MIKRELSIFLVVGLLTVLIDFLSYTCLYRLDILNVSAAKAAGFLCGTIFAYLANRAWTFGHQTHMAASLWRFIILYSITLGANVAINWFVLLVTKTIPFSVLLSFVLATGVSACLNFIGMKFFVFRQSPGV